MKILIIFLIFFALTVDGHRREKRTINRFLRYFGYKLTPITDTESVSQKYENPPAEQVPAFQRLRSIFPSRLELEWTTESTKTKEKIKVTESTTTTESTTEFLIQVPDAETIAPTRSPRQSDNETVVTEKMEGPLPTNDVNNQRGYEYFPPPTNSLNYEVVKSNDIYIDSSVDSPLQNFISNDINNFYTAQSNLGI